MWSKINHSIVGIDHYLIYDEYFLYKSNAVYDVGLEDAYIIL